MRSEISQYARRIPEWVVFVVGLVPLAWLIWLIVGGKLGFDPVKSLEHELGIIGLQFLLASLCITPLLRFARINLCKFRRPLGLLGFTYIVLHFLTWMILDLSLRWSQIGADLVKRPYIVVGFIALVLLVPLALTSWRGAMRRLGQMTWCRLHRLSYVAVILGAIHFVMQEKVWTAESVIYLTITLLLVASRFIWIRVW